jgi:hypothetical protein
MTAPSAAREFLTADLVARLTAEYNAAKHNQLSTSR